MIAVQQETGEAFSELDEMSPSIIISGFADTGRQSSLLDRTLALSTSAGIIFALYPSGVTLLCLASLFQRFLMGSKEKCIPIGPVASN